MIIPPCLCLICKHFYYGKFGRKCKAFPRGIPREILTNEFDHHYPHPKDNGIQFVHKDTEEEEI